MKVRCLWIGWRVRRDDKPSRHALVVLFIAGVLTVSSYARLDPKTIAGVWLLDESTGNTAKDSSRNENDGTLMNGPKRVDGKFGKALSFDGVDDYVDCGGNTILNTNTQRTVSLWFKTSLAVNQTMVGRNGGNGQWLLGIQNSQLKWHDWINGGTQDLGGTTAIVDGKWHFAAATLDTSSGKKIRFYLDGELNAEGACTSMGTPTGNFFIGSTVQVAGAAWSDDAGYKHYSQVLIDDVALFNVALAEADILTLMDKGLGVAFGLTVVALPGKLTATWATIKAR